VSVQLKKTVCIIKASIVCRATLRRLRHCRQTLRRWSVGFDVKDSEYNLEIYVIQFFGCIGVWISCSLSFMQLWIDLFIMTSHWHRHCCSWSAEGCSILHDVWSSLSTWAGPADKPLSSCICWSHILRGWFQSVAGEFQLGLQLITETYAKPLCVLVSVTRRQIWPSRECGFSAMKDSRSDSFVLSLIAVLVTMCYDFAPMIWPCDCTATTKGNLSVVTLCRYWLCTGSRWVESQKWEMAGRECCHQSAQAVLKKAPRVTGHIW